VNDINIGEATIISVDIKSTKALVLSHLVAQVQMFDTNNELLYESQLTKLEQKVVNGGIIYRAYTSIDIPSTVRLNGNKETCILQWTLHDKKTTLETQQSITVNNIVQTGLGPQSVVELYENTACLTLELPNNTAILQVYSGNEILAQHDLTSVTETEDGYFFEKTLDFAYEGMFPSLDEYILVWKSGKETTTTKLWVVNPSIMASMHDLLLFINRINRKARLEELEFMPEHLVFFLKQARDMFNGHSYITNFTLINATGAIQSFMLMFAQVLALRTWYLDEGSRSFDFSGQAVSLSVDITQYIDSVLGQIQNHIDSYLPKFKQQLTLKGVTSGDGNMNAIGAGRLKTALGVSIGPASNTTFPIRF
jgi:hypothetical protein